MKRGALKSNARKRSRVDCRETRAERGMGGQFEHKAAKGTKDENREKIQQVATERTES
jgi:hypothetical protein